LVLEARSEYRFDFRIHRLPGLILQNLSQLGFTVARIARHAQYRAYDHRFELRLLLRTKLLANNREMRRFDQFFRMHGVPRQQRGDDPLSAIESAPKDIIAPPETIEECAEMNQHRAGELLPRFRGSGFVDNAGCVVRTDSYDTRRLRLSHGS